MGGGGGGGHYRHDPQSLPDLATTNVCKVDTSNGSNGTKITLNKKLACSIKSNDLHRIASSRQSIGLDNDIKLNNQEFKEKKSSQMPKFLNEYTVHSFYSWNMQ